MGVGRRDAAGFVSAVDIINKKLMDFVKKRARTAAIASTVLLLLLASSTKYVSMTSLTDNETQFEPPETYTGDMFLCERVGHEIECVLDLLALEVHRYYYYGFVLPPW